MSDYLTDEEQAQRLERWWEHYGLLVVGAVVLAVLAVVGYRWYQDQLAERQALGAALYEDFLVARGDRSLALAEEIDELAAGTGYPVLARFKLAAQAIAAEDYDRARSRYDEILTQAAVGAVRDLALVRLARLEQQLGNTDAALAALRRARSEGFRSLVAELQGDVQLAGGDERAAYESYRAALAARGEGQANPLLELKVSTTAGAERPPVSEDAVAED